MSLPLDHRSLILNSSSAVHRWYSQSLCHCSCSINGDYPVEQGYPNPFSSDCTQILRDQPLLCFQACYRSSRRATWTGNPILSPYNQVFSFAHLAATIITRHSRGLATLNSDWHGTFFGQFDTFQVNKSQSTSVQPMISSHYGRGFSRQFGVFPSNCDQSWLSKTAILHRRDFHLHRDIIHPQPMDILTTATPVPFPAAGHYPTLSFLSYQSLLSAQMGTSFPILFIGTSSSLCISAVTGKDFDFKYITTATLCSYCPTIC